MNGCSVVREGLFDELGRLRDVGSGVGEADAARSSAICVLAGPSDPSARGANAVVRRPNNRDARLCRAPQRHGRQVLASGEELDVQFQLRAGLAAHQCPRSGTGRAVVVQGMLRERISK